MTTFTKFTLLSLLSIFILTQPALSQITCKTKTFTTKNTTFVNCNDLPTLNGVLHWSFNPSLSTLSMAFTAPPPKNGWVSFALNPKKTGMVGAQALIAFKPKPSSPVTVSTYDIKSYQEMPKGPISYDVTHLSAEESSNGEITIFATWLVAGGFTSVNMVWQVGPIVSGEIGPHEFVPENLKSFMKLDLVEVSDISPTGAPTASPSGEPSGAPADSPSGGELSGAPADSPDSGTGTDTDVKTAPAPTSNALKNIKFMSIALALGALGVSFLV